VSLLHGVVSVIPLEGLPELEESDDLGLLLHAAAERAGGLDQARHGFVYASAGVDASNAPSEGTLVLLPLDPDRSARRLRARLLELGGVDVAVIVSDSFGRAWRQGTTDVALGVAGIAPLLDLRGTADARGRELRTTQIAVADEIAGAAELVLGKSRRIPAAIVRGVDARGDGSASELVMPRERDLFR
jgi:coenzyme F420-0:L-glutamate ligase / coenzyme F420-1:gamma-L-glutamate ligase